MKNRTGEREKERSLPLLMGEMTSIAASDDADTAIDRMLALIGAGVGASRAYVMQEEPGGRYLRNTYEWVNSNVGPAMSSWPLYDMERDIPSLRSIMAGRDPVASHTSDMPPDQRRVLAMQAVQSVLMVSMYRGEKWIGLVGFDQCDREREWGEEEKIPLMHLCGLVKLVLERREYLSASLQLAAIREALDRHDFSAPSQAPRRERRRPVSASVETLPGRESFEDANRKILAETLILFGGNKSMAARHLGVSWDTLNRRCKKYGVDAREYAGR